MTDDITLFETVETRLFTAVIGDVMDTQGLTRQFLPPSIRGLSPDFKVVGRAMPVLEADCVGDVVAHTGRTDGFGLMFRALDDLKSGEVYVCTGASPRYALWGGLMSTRARHLGARGAVLGGFHRDTREILELGFPVFSGGSYAQDQRLRGRVIDFRCTIEFENGAQVRPGDLIVGDIDGVLAVPRDHVEDILRLALAKVEGEDRVRRMIHAGESTAAIFDKTGIM
ncbi:MAG TPA: RraA family protein [Stellaceae bacterium]|nr:RraA family protein [Stellaceae bacterium]